MDVTQCVFMISGLWDEISEEDEKTLPSGSASILNCFFVHPQVTKKEQMQIFKCF